MSIVRTQLMQQNSKDDIKSYYIVGKIVNF